MQLIATDILADICGLSLVPLCTGLGIGLFLWLFGWWSHRFWVVLVTTVLAGLFSATLALAPEMTVGASLVPTMVMTTSCVVVEPWPSSTVTT